ncbi:MAG: CGNR zinc finger domain-containing protein [Marmoricola sp.]
MQFDSHILALLGVTVRLVNAVTPGSDGGRDVVRPTGDVLVDAVAAALANGGRIPRVDRASAQTLASVAGAARVVFDRVASGDIDAAAGQVNLLLGRTRARPRLDHFGDAGWSLHFHGPDDTLAVGWAAGIASGLALALGSDLAGRLGVCDAPACDRVYVDASRNSGRRFCSTRCQSRVKAAVHRSRTTTSG